ncbi:hypothetical protein ACF06W_18470 [Streptomyces albus]|uniref:hypothetical protein n=1 Tax=Streptomyces albus TaxID=1888 RepID=UPI0036F955C8
MPLPGDIASTSTDLLFADMPAITVEDTSTQARLDVLVEEGRVQQTLISGAEQAAALGSVYLRATGIATLSTGPSPNVVQPDAALPEFRFVMLRAVAFWRELETGDAHTVLRHFERHEPGRTTHALYGGTADNVGRPVPLTEHPDTAELSASPHADGNGQRSARYPGPDSRVRAEHAPEQAAPLRPLGRSDYAAPLYDLFDGLDETWMSWMRDIRLVPARLIVPGQEGRLLPAPARRHAARPVAARRMQFGQRITSERPNIEFGAGLAESEQQTATTLDLLNRADAISAKTKVKILHHEWDDSDV